MVECARVLIVDDEALVTRLLETAFKGDGWEARSALSYAEAAKLIDTEPFDAFVVDKNLPEGSGVELLRRARSKDERAACVLITAYSSAASARETMQIDVDAYLEKPFEDIAAVVTRVREICRRRAQIVSTRPTTARPLRVLVASPDAEVRSFIAARFERSDDRIVCLEKSAEILATCRELEPDLTVLDTCLTDPDVLAIIGFLATRAVVVVTQGAPAAREVIRYIDLSVRAVLERPLTEAGFAAEMDGLIWRLRTRRQ